MKEREQFDYVRFGAGHLGQALSISIHTRPVRLTVNPVPAQRELISNDAHELSIIHSLVRLTLRMPRGRRTRTPLHCEPAACRRVHAEVRHHRAYTAGPRRRIGSILPSTAT